MYGLKTPGLCALRLLCSASVILTPIQSTLQVSNGTILVQMRLSHLVLLPYAACLGMIQHPVEVTDSGTINEASHGISVPQETERVIELTPAKPEKALALGGGNEKHGLIWYTRGLERLVGKLAMRFEACGSRISTRTVGRRPLRSQLLKNFSTSSQSI
uniref:Secreted protein n=1 Tax=Peronospora matthiolae TaxID=2874970 RepID=A0AAV1TMZ0_9STRA